MSKTKYVFFIMFSFIVGILFLFKVDANTNDLPLLGRVIFVDPGHGGYL